MKTGRILAIQIVTIIGAWYALDAYLYSTDGFAESPIFGIIVAGCFFLAPHLIRSS
jgi:hypothetical protein